MIDRPRAKGGWIEPPAAKRRADFSACWDEREAAFGGLAVSVGGLWFCSGRLDKKNQCVSSDVSGLFFLSLTSYLILGIVLKSAR